MSAILNYLENGKRYLSSDCGNELPRTTYIGFDTLIIFLSLLSTELWKKVKSQPSWIISKTVWDIWILMPVLRFLCPKT